MGVSDAHHMIMSRYAWHPLNAPPLPPYAIASKIALIGPIGKCLETAVYELCDEDQMHSAEDGCNSEHVIDNVGVTDAETDSASMLGQRPGSNGRDRDHHTFKNGVYEGIALRNREMTKTNHRTMEMNPPYNEAPRSAFKSSPQRNVMDQKIAVSILESYGNSVANTIFDNRKKSHTQSSNKDQLYTTTNVTAPAALLKGEVDHYNRIGGQWRLVVKNAVLTSRNVTQVNNAKAGSGQRTRFMLDWDSNDAPASNYDLDTEAVDDCDTRASKKRKQKDRVDSYCFQGTIQILAYGDDT